MQVIHKQVLRIINVQSIEVPKNSEFLSVQYQKDQLVLWYLFDEDTKPQETWRIRIAGTGFPVDLGDSTYFDTVQMGHLVWHIFMEKR